MSEIERINAVSTQLWRDTDGQVHDGAWLYRRLIALGFDAEKLALHLYGIGQCVKTGVSAYERIK